MSRRVSPSTDKVYGLSRVTRLWGVARATLYRHRRPTKVVERRRKVGMLHKQVFESFQ